MVPRLTFSLVVNWDVITREKEYIGLKNFKRSQHIVIITAIRLDHCCWDIRNLEKNNEKLNVTNYKVKVKCEPPEFLMVLQIFSSIGRGQKS